MANFPNGTTLAMRPDRQSDSGEKGSNVSERRPAKLWRKLPAATDIKTPTHSRQVAGVYAGETIIEKEKFS